MQNQITRQVHLVKNFQIMTILIKNNYGNKNQAGYHSNECYFDEARCNSPPINPDYLNPRVSQNDYLGRQSDNKTLDHKFNRLDLNNESRVPISGQSEKLPYKQIQDFQRDS